MQDETGRIISLDLRARVTSLQVPGVALKGMPRKSSSESPRRAVKTVHPRCDGLIIVRCAYKAAFRWLCANPRFTWRCIITIIVHFTVLQFFGRRGWEIGQAAWILANFVAGNVEKQRRERKPAISVSKGKTFTRRVYVVTARNNFIAFTVHGFYKFRTAQREISIRIFCLSLSFWEVNEFLMEEVILCIGTKLIFVILLNIFSLR